MSNTSMRAPTSGDPLAVLPEELRQSVLTQLSPHDVALGWRLTCKDAAQRYSGPHHRTARVGQLLPPHAVAATWCVEGVLAALRGMCLEHKVAKLLRTAASSGCETNMELAWKALQRILFPELLPSAFYDDIVKGADTGPVAVASGLAHLLPLLHQRCPGLLDPARTLEAAARHCDLPGLQAAWEVLGHRFLSSLGFRDGDNMRNRHRQYQERVQGVWRPMLAAAAGSATPDAVAKLEWLLAQTRYPEVPLDREDVCGAAAASGDLTRLQWLRERGFPWGTAPVLRAVLQHADMGCIQRVEEEGGYLPPEGDAAWSGRAVMCAAAAAPRDSAAKLRWLAGKGVRLVREVAVTAAAKHGNLEALQLLLEHQRVDDDDPLIPRGDLISLAVEAGSVHTATWLRQAGGGAAWLSPKAMMGAARRGDLAMVRWLLDVGCPREDICLSELVYNWFRGKPADGEGLVEAARLLAAAGWPGMCGADRGTDPVLAAARAGQLWDVWPQVREQLPADAWGMPKEHDAMCAAFAGCEGMLEAMVGLGVRGVYGSDLESYWYGSAAKMGDLGTLACLRRLGVPLGDRALTSAVGLGAPLCVLQWLVGQGAPVVGGSEVGGPLRRLRLYSHSYDAKREQERQAIEAWLVGLMEKPVDGP